MRRGSLREYLEPSKYSTNVYYGLVLFLLSIKPKIQGYNDFNMGFVINCTTLNKLVKFFGPSCLFSRLDRGPVNLQVCSVYNILCCDLTYLRTTLVLFLVEHLELF